MHWDVLKRLKIPNIKRFKNVTSSPFDIPDDQKIVNALYSTQYKNSVPSTNFKTDKCLRNSVFSRLVIACTCFFCVWLRLFIHWAPRYSLCAPFSYCTSLPAVQPSRKHCGTLHRDDDLCFQEVVTRDLFPFWRRFPISDGFFVLLAISTKEVVC